MEASEGIGEASKLPAARATRAPNEAEHEPLEMEYVVDKAPEHMPAEKPVVKSRNPEPEVSCFNAVFATRQLASRGNRSLYIKFSRRELFIYIPYLITISIMVFRITSGTTYYYTRVMYNLFIDVEVTGDTDTGSNPSTTFLDSSDVHDFWNYVRGPMLNGLYWESYYGKAMNLKVKDITDKEKKFGILYENQLVGIPRLRQLRVLNYSCLVRRNYRHLDRECFPEYSQEHEDKGVGNETFWSDVNLLDLSNAVKDAWKYRKDEGYGHGGKLASYSGNGGVETLQKTSAETAQRMGQLQQNLWITRATRAVFLDFAVYNANINLFCVVKLLWEFPASGGVTTSYSLRTVRLIRYLTNWDSYFLLPIEILFCIFTLYYLIQELTEMAHLGCKEYLEDIWSWLDFSTLLLSFTCIGFSIYRYFLVRRTLKTLTISKNNELLAFEFLAYWETQFNHLISLTVFLVWVKIFKYISFNATMTQLSRTLSRCAKDVLSFAIMFFVVFFAFAQLGYLLFGSQLEDYSTFMDTVFTLSRLLLGEVYFLQLYHANRIMGPIFFIAYTFFIFFVLLNMFLAIINDTYSAVKAEVSVHRTEFGISDYFKGVVNGVRGAFGKNKARKLDAETAARLAMADGKITQHELRNNLIMHHFNPVEIEMFLARFELEEDRVLDEEESQHVLDDMASRPTHTTAAAPDQHQLALLLPDQVIEGAEVESNTIFQNEQVYRMQKRVEVIEGSALTELLSRLLEIRSQIAARNRQLVAD